MAYLIRRNHDELTRVGLENIAHIPFLMWRDMSYPDAANAYLRERSLGTWNLRSRKASAYGESRDLSEETVENYAQDLKVFLSYIEYRKLDWRQISYGELLETYDVDLGTGKFRKDGEPLAASTINRRVDRASEFLLYSFDRGHRGPFEIKTRKSSRANSPASRRRGMAGRSETEIRFGARRIHPTRLKLPLRPAINAWLAEIRARFGRTIYLAAKFIIKTGCRLQETSLVRASQIPDPSEIDLHFPARMEICYGTKGGRAVGDKSLRGNSRELRFARSFAVELDRYRRLSRSKCLELFRENCPGADEPAQLFLDEKTGKPISAQMLYRAWHAVPFPENKGWSPHLGRHTFACATLLKLLEEEAEALQLTLQTLPRTDIITRCEKHVPLYLTPVMGHLSEKTTASYLNWVADLIYLPSYRRNWGDYLDDE